MQPRITSLDIECAVAAHFGWRQNVTVPNVSWGLGFRHELDLIIVKPQSGYAYEAEIKVSAPDLKRDPKKNHTHESCRIRKLYFAIPKWMAESIVFVPEKAGVFLVSDGGYCELARTARLNKDAKPLSQNEMEKLYHLASMRTWSLKETLRQRIKRSRVHATS